jgi:DNA-directed RNA polymerase specialized sigma24 family protein
LVLHTPLRDREIAALLGLTPRAVIRARQHARERLRTSLQNLADVRG